MPYECLFCNGTEPPAFLITPLAGGDTLAVSEGCAAVAFTGLLADQLGLEMEDLYKAVQREAKRQAAAAAQTEQAAAGVPSQASKRGRRRPGGGGGQAASHADSDGHPGEEGTSGLGAEQGAEGASGTGDPG